MSHKQEAKRSVPSLLQEEDTVQHTLVECMDWDELRRALNSEIGDDLSLPTVVQKKFSSAKSWDAVVTFCEDGPKMVDGQNKKVSKFK